MPHQVLDMGVLSQRPVKIMDYALAANLVVMCAQENVNVSQV